MSAVSLGATPVPGAVPDGATPVAVPPMTVGLIGVGRVGSVLATALAAAGYEIVAANAHSAASRARARRTLPGVALLPAARVAAAARLVLLAVPDDSLPTLAARLASVGAVGPGQVVVHASGAHGIAVLAPLARAGAATLAVHPAMTFTGGGDDLDRLRTGISFGVTAPAGAPAALRTLAGRLVADLGGSLEWVAESARPLYHAALAHGANHLVTLINESLDRLRDAGVRHPEQVLAPLVRASLENTLRSGDAALTGPVARGDAGTVARHLAVLAETAPDSRPAYLSLARRTADRAIASGRLAPGDAGALLGVLASPEPPVATPISAVPATAETAAAAPVGPVAVPA